MPFQKGNKVAVGHGRPRKQRKPTPEVLTTLAAARESSLADAEYETLISVYRELVRRLETQPAQYTTDTLIDLAQRLTQNYNRAKARLISHDSWAGLRFATLERDNFTCRYCGRTPLRDSVVLQADHIVPRSKGGLDTLENLITACEDCNRGKLDTHLSEVSTEVVRSYIDHATNSTP